MRRLFATGAGMLVATLLSSASSVAGTVTFGSGANAFNMEFVTIGNPGNAADSVKSSGSVGYAFQLGKFEVTRDMIAKYNTIYGNGASQAITLADMGSYGANGASRPATGVSWNEAARFVNWMNTSTGGHAAYKFTTAGVNDNIVLWDSSDVADYDPSNPFRSKRATYVLPSYQEWYKAAYYDPSMGATGGYWTYPTASDSVPTKITTNSTASGTAVYNNDAGGTGTVDADQAGGLSAYGVMGMAGNALEWTESNIDATNGNHSSVAPGFIRVLLGGGFRNQSQFMSSSYMISNQPQNAFPGNENIDFGFRVASISSRGGEVPEPTSMAIFGLGALGMAYRARRKCKT